ncbi:hypothetical protein EGW08_012929, partial [Elysia chlorotica]
TLPLQDGSVLTHTDYALVVWSDADSQNTGTVTFANMSNLSFTHVYKSHLEKFLLSASNEVTFVSCHIHKVNGACLCSLKLSNHGAVECLPVADLVVCAAGNDLQLLLAITHTLE